METSKWEGTKQPVMIIYNDYSSSYYMQSNQVFDDETLEEGNANARLFTDALHTMQQYGMMPSELKESFDKMKQVRAKEVEFWQDAHRKESLNNSKLREENVKLKLEIEEMKNKSLEISDKVEEQTGGRSLEEVLESEENFKEALSEIRCHMYERATSYDVHDLINETLTKAGFPYEPED